MNPLFTADERAANPPHTYTLLALCSPSKKQVAGPKKENVTMEKTMKEKRMGKEEIGLAVSLF